MTRSRLAALAATAVLVLAACAAPADSAPAVEGPMPTCAPAPITPATPPGPVASYRDGAAYDC
ncbi:hypothetical protein ACFV0L_43585 [Streptosporangium canum]|uniref:hypothetical protein n=1 Tax=Streptosporangium canum TaxID=324952 RepID=UPI00368693FA